MLPMPVRVPLEVDLPDNLQECHQLILELVSDIGQYRSRIDYLTRRVFGRRSERIDPSELTFFGEKDFPGAEVEEEPAAAQDEPTDKKRTGGSGRNGRRRPPKDLPRRREVHDVPEEQKVCCECGCEKKPIGEEVSEQLEYIPASLYVIEHVRLKYACPRCQGQVVVGEKPPQPIEKGLAGPGLLAQVITSKYCDHLPLHRQESIFARHGVDLSRKTLCDWVIRSAAVLEAVVKAMRRDALKSYCINTDDTPVSVQDTGRAHKSFFWVYLGDRDHPHTIYDFTWTRSRDGPEKFLAGYQGFLQADAYSGYDGLYADGSIIEVGCWAHARRYFFDAKLTAPVVAHQALLRIKELYAIEREAKARMAKHPNDWDRALAERLALRQEKAVPILEAFGTWLRELQPSVLPKSPLGEAIQYTLNNWTALNRYASDPRLEIDNNPAERALRPLCVGRGNWLFAGSERGGHAAAILYSLIASAKRHGLDPFAYLRDLLARIPTHPQRDIEQLFPNNWKALDAQP
jgi:transposase